MGETRSVILNGRRFVLRENSGPGQATYMARDDSREDQRNPYRGPFQRDSEEEEEFPQRDIVLKVRRNRTDEVLGGLTSKESTSLGSVLPPVENGEATGADLFELTILRPLKVQGFPMPDGRRYGPNVITGEDDRWPGQSAWAHSFGRGLFPLGNEFVGVAKWRIDKYSEPLLALRGVVLDDEIGASIRKMQRGYVKENQNSVGKSFTLAIERGRLKGTARLRSIDQGITVNWWKADPKITGQARLLGYAGKSFIIISIIPDTIDIASSPVEQMPRKVASALLKNSC